MNTLMEAPNENKDGAAPPLLLDEMKLLTQVCSKYPVQSYDLWQLLWKNISIAAHGMNGAQT